MTFSGYLMERLPKSRDSGPQQKGLSGRKEQGTTAWPLGGRPSLVGPGVLWSKIRLYIHIPIIH